MNKINKSVPPPKSRQFKEKALSYLNEIYGTALRLSNDEALAEELTVLAYVKVCRRFFRQHRDDAELRVDLHRELLRTSIYYQLVSLHRSGV